MTRERRPWASERFVWFVCVFFAVKPFVDLTWFLKISVGGSNVGAAHAVGGALAFYGIVLAIVHRQTRPLAHTLFVGFSLSYGVSALLATLGGSATFDLGTVDRLCRVVASVGVLHIGYLIGLRRNDGDAVQLLKAIFFGNSAALALNGAAILLDIELGKDLRSDMRFGGVYYDPGVLAINAVQNVVFALYLAPGFRGWLQTVVRFGIPCMAIGLVGASGSRSAVVLLLAALLVYVAMYQRGGRKVSSFIAVAAVLGLLLTALDSQTNIVIERFTTELETVGDLSTKGIGEVGFDAQGDFSLGNVERFGNNRGKNWAISLGEFLRRPIEMQILGDFESDSCHCDYIDILARNGVLGLGIYVCLLWHVLGATFRSFRTARSSVHRMVSTVAFSLVLMYALYSVPFRPSVYTTNAWYMWLLVGWTIARSVAQRPRWNAGNNQSRVRQSAPDMSSTRLDAVEPIRTTRG